MFCLSKEPAPDMKRTWTKFIVRVVPLLAVAAAVVIEFEDATGRKWA